MGSTDAVIGRRTRRPSTRRYPRPHQSPVTRAALHEHTFSGERSALSGALRELWDTGVEESRRAAAQMRRLADFWADRDAPDADFSAGDDADMQVALALRISEHTAYRRIRDAHVATHQLPALFSRLENGELPLPWMSRVLRGVGDMSEEQRRAVDAEVSTWELTLTADQFGRRLAIVLTRIRSREPRPPEQSPRALRRVEVLPADQEGMACLNVIGPVPAVRSLALRLDATARAVQATQRRAIETADGAAQDPAAFSDAPIPLDDGTVRESGRAMSLAKLRFDLLTGALLDSDGTSVPGERFRINVTVPAMTLLGADDSPGLLDGDTPIPADMARSLAGGDAVWHRVLTDPTTGAFLPLPSQRYAPTQAMLEHLRLRTGTCAVPTCTRPVSWAAECDHIEEYDHRAPGQGGQTEIENLHLLCWQHHQAKTAGRLDPIRLGTNPRDTEHEGALSREPGATRWVYGSSGFIDATDDTDLVTPWAAAALEAHWNRHLALEHERKRRTEPGREHEHREKRDQTEETNPPVDGISAADHEVYPASQSVRPPRSGNSSDSDYALPNREDETSRRQEDAPTRRNTESMLPAHRSDMPGGRSAAPDRNTSAPTSTTTARAIKTALPKFRIAANEPRNDMAGTGTGTAGPVTEAPAPKTEVAEPSTGVTEPQAGFAEPRAEQIDRHDRYNSYGPPPF